MLQIQASRRLPEETVQMEDTGVAVTVEGVAVEGTAVEDTAVARTVEEVVVSVAAEGIVEEAVEAAVEVEEEAHAERMSTIRDPFHLSASRSAVPTAKEDDYTYEWKVELYDYV